MYTLFCTIFGKHWIRIQDTARHAAIQLLSSLNVRGKQTIIVFNQIIIWRNFLVLLLKILRICQNNLALNVFRSFLISFFLSCCKSVSVQDMVWHIFPDSANSSNSIPPSPPPLYYHTGGVFSLNWPYKIWASVAPPPPHRIIEYNGKQSIHKLLVTLGKTS